MYQLLEIRKNKIEILLQSKELEFLYILRDLKQSRTRARLSEIRYAVRPMKNATPQTSKNINTPPAQAYNAKA